MRINHRPYREKEDLLQIGRLIRHAHSYIPDLDLILLSAEGEVAAFCTVWLDRESGLAEFEPVGTVPRYRKRGLGAPCWQMRATACAPWGVERKLSFPGANRWAPTDSMPVPGSRSRTSCTLGSGRGCEDAR